MSTVTLLKIVRELYNVYSYTFGTSVYAAPTHELRCVGASIVIATPLL
jgi:hypothetical protein